MNKKYNFIDLFAGCGGLTEGFYQQNYHALLHLEFDQTACLTLKERMNHYGYSKEEIENAVLCKDITSGDILDDISKRVKDKVDIIIGGPPCQAFSTAGRAQDPNSMENDPRNYLFESYMKILNYYKPKIFVFENVKGLLTAKPKGVEIFKLILNKMEENYCVSSDVKKLLFNSINYGVPQVRERLIIIGVRKDLNINVDYVYNSIIKTHYSIDEGPKDNLKKYVTVKEAISDLPSLLPGEGEEKIKFNYPLSNDYLKIVGKNNDGYLYNHVARYHNEKDRERYRILSKNQWQLKDLIKTRPDLVHHDPKHFNNRYTVQVYDKPGRTVVAHLYKDGNLFIHPDYKQERTFTVREAARIQSFPDDFIFMGSKTEQYKQVGNAVPPLMSLAIAKGISNILEVIKDV